MTLLSPWFLLGLLAVAVPLVAHLRRLSAQTRVRFSAVDFIELRPPRTANRRWEDIALLVARILALALFAFAFARPYSKEHSSQSDAVASRAKRRMVLLDRSASMRRGGADSEALTKVRDLARMMPEFDEFEIVAFDRKAQTVLSTEVWRQTARGERSALVDGLLRGEKPGWNHAHLDDALRFAAEQHATSPGRIQTEVVVVSDFQEGTVLAGLQGFAWPEGLSVRLVQVGPGASSTPPAAVGVHWLAPEGVDGNPDAPLRVQLSPSPGFRGDRVKMRMESAKPMEWVAAVHSGRLSTLSIPAPPVDYGYIRAEGADDFGAGVWVARVPQSRALVALGGANEPPQRTGSRYFLERALGAIGTARVDLATGSSLPTARDSAVNLWLLSGSADTEWTRRMRAAMENGATGVATIDDATDGKSLSALTGETVSVTEAAVDGYTVLGATDRTHPVFSAFSTPQFADFSALRFWKYRKIGLSENSRARVLARFESGDAAVLEFAVGSGRLIVWASGWHSQDGQWVLSSRCVPFLSGCLDYAGNGRRPLLVGSPGEPVSLPVATQNLKRIDGVQLAAGGARAVVEEPGVYLMEPQGGVVVINVARDERRFESIPVAQLEALGLPLVKGAASGVVPEPAVVGARKEASNEALAARDMESRQSWWRIVLGAVFALVVVETVWAARLSARRSQFV